MNFKEFILGMISTTETSVNSKIVAGFITLFAAIIFGAFKLLEPMIVLAGLVAAFFGLSSLDFKSVIKEKPPEV